MSIKIKELKSMRACVQNASYFADFTLEFLDYFLSLQRFDFQGVKLTRCPKLQFHDALHSFHCTVFSVSTDIDEYVRIGDF